MHHNNRPRPRSPSHPSRCPPPLPPLRHSALHLHLWLHRWPTASLVTTPHALVS